MIHMAFGSSMRKKSDTSVTKSDKPRGIFISPILDLKPGLRQFRLLPAMPLHEVAFNGITIYAPEPEIGFAEYWITVKDSKNPKGSRKLRVFVDPQNRFDNYIWREVMEPMPKEVKGVKNPERAMAKSKFAINVYDRTPVVFAEDGMPIYPNQAGEYLYNGVTYDAGAKTPRNAIMILEGSNGSEGGDHILGRIENLVNNMTHDVEGVDQAVPPYGYDIRITSTIPKGGQPQDVTRAVLSTAIRKLPDQDLVWSLPRYEIEHFYKPYPDEALKDLIEGVDVQEVFEAYDIVKWVRLPETPEAF